MSDKKPNTIAFHFELDLNLFCSFMNNPKYMVFNLIKTQQLAANFIITFYIKCTYRYEWNE